ncbi:hypothetical protein PEB0149_006530 [Bartonella apis]|uniref:Uncharacterized protein n=1 Tax=Bartonella apis TaxID=1686310 RepID=A0A1R0F8H2_9HYPH|nr:hypothetical protein PEB0149_006530 [Bartonella apis]
MTGRVSQFYFQDIAALPVFFLQNKLSGRRFRRTSYSDDNNEVPSELAWSWTFIFSNLPIFNIKAMDKCRTCQCILKTPDVYSRCKK